MNDMYTDDLRKIIPADVKIGMRIRAKRHDGDVIVEGTVNRRKENQIFLGLGHSAFWIALPGWELFEVQSIA